MNILQLIPDVKYERPDHFQEADYVEVAMVIG